MTRVFIGVGSNQDREKYILSGLSVLREQFGELTISPVYENEAVGFAGEDFYNFVVAFDSDLGIDDIYLTLRKIEDSHGRDRSQPKFSPRTLDLDMLLYGDVVVENERYQLPRDDILNYAFVLRPLAEIAGDLVHPVLGTTYSDLWAQFDQSSQQLRPVELDLN